MTAAGYTRRIGPVSGTMLVVGTASRYRAPFYPALLILFVAACLAVVAGAVISNPGNAMRGLLLLAAGVPVFHWWSRRRDAGRRTH